ncbi:MAG: hypothetical protein JXO48_00665 [Deltaproteobacteria bacterium]|nr:hypothetical protein [Deltaproteobacteria bacterium]
MELIDRQRFMDMVNGDREFAIVARYWNAILRFDAGGDKCLVTITEGKVTDIDPDPDMMEDWNFDFFITAPDDEWEQLLDPAPRPFYQALLPAVMLHGFDHGGDFEMFCAYYRAFSRMIEIMRLCRPAAS